MLSDRTFYIWNEHESSDLYICWRTQFIMRWLKIVRYKRWRRRRRRWRRRFICFYDAFRFFSSSSSLLFGFGKFSLAYCWIRLIDQVNVPKAQQRRMQTNAENIWMSGKNGNTQRRRGKKAIMQNTLKTILSSTRTSFQIFCVFLTNCEKKDRTESIGQTWWWMSVSAVYSETNGRFSRIIFICFLFLRFRRAASLARFSIYQCANPIFLLCIWIEANFL